MDHQLAVGVVVVVQTGLVLAQDEVGLEADHVMEEAAELVDLTLNDDVRARVLLKVSLVLNDILFEHFRLLRQLIDLVSQLEHGEEVLGVGKRLLLSDASLKVLHKCLKTVESLKGEILRRRRVLLDTFKVLDG